MLHESQIPRSCDRCHALKERCQRQAGTSTCRRCDRLRLQCLSNRLMKRPGRPPRPYCEQARKPSPMVTPSQSPSPSPVSKPPDETFALASYSLSAPGDLEGTDPDVGIMHQIFADDVLKWFVLPSFCSAHRESLILHLTHSRALMMDALIACIISMPRLEEDPCAPLDAVRLSSSYTRASIAVAALRNLQVRDMFDVSICQTLGLYLLTFGLRLGGHDTLAICRNVLGMSKSIYESHDSRMSANLAFMSCLVMHEVSECLMRTEVPSLRPRPAATPEVDRYFGICYTLCPYFYDLCQLSNDMLRKEGSGLNDRLDALELVIHTWQPEIPKHFTDHFTPVETSHIVCQANVMQTAALLIVHRLRHPFGTEQAAALALSSSIIRQLNITRSVTEDTPRGVDLPLMVACLEIEDEIERSLNVRKSSSIRRYSGLFPQRIERWMSAVWEARRKRRDMFWYHLGSVVVTPT